MAKKKGEKYEAILDAAVKVIAANGYANSQVSKIAREAGVADGTIYLYFDSKEEILIDLFNEFMGQFIEEVRQEITAMPDVVSKLRKLVEAHLTKLEANPDLATVTQVELRQSDPRLRLALGETLRGYFRLIEELVEEGKTQGIFAPELNKYLARQMIFGTLDDIVTRWVWSRRHYSLAAQVPQVFQMLLHGLCGR